MHYSSLLDCVVLCCVVLCNWHFLLDLDNGDWCGSSRGEREREIHSFIHVSTKRFFPCHQLAHNIMHACMHAWKILLLFISNLHHKMTVCAREPTGELLGQSFGLKIFGLATRPSVSNDATQSLRAKSGKCARAYFLPKQARSLKKEKQTFMTDSPDHSRILGLFVWQTSFLERKRSRSFFFLTPKMVRETENTFLPNHTQQMMISVVSLNSTTVLKIVSCITSICSSLQLSCHAVSCPVLSCRAQATHGVSVSSSSASLFRRLLYLLYSL